MLGGVLRGVEITAGFLSEYQRNFRFIVFDSSQSKPREDVSRRVAFTALRLDPGGGEGAIGQVGGSPRWLLDDEAPSMYQSAPMVSLFQFYLGLTFETLEGVPPQVELGLTGEPRPCPFEGYQLFLGNALYCFGTARPAVPVVYALTQVD